MIAFTTFTLYTSLAFTQAPPASTPQDPQGQRTAAPAAGSPFPNQKAPPPPPPQAPPPQAPPPQQAPPQPYPQQQQPYPPANDSSDRNARTRGGVAFLVMAPAMVAISVPISLSGNAAWRNDCGPNSSLGECSSGTWLSMTARGLNGLLFSSASVFGALGGKRIGTRMAIKDRAAGREMSDGAPFLLGGGVLMTVSFATMIGMRAYFWETTPQCTTYSCVEQGQNLATLVMSGLALSAATGAAFVGYGQGYRRRKRIQERNLVLLPQTGRGFAGLRLRGEF